MFSNDIGQSLLFTAVFLASIFALPLLLAWLDQPRQDQGASPRAVTRASKTRSLIDPASSATRSKGTVDVVPMAEATRSTSSQTLPPRDSAYHHRPDHNPFDPWESSIEGQGFGDDDSEVHERQGTQPDTQAGQAG